MHDEDVCKGSFHRVNLCIYANEFEEQRTMSKMDKMRF